MDESSDASSTTASTEDASETTSQIRGWINNIAGLQELFTDWIENVFNLDILFNEAEVLPVAAIESLPASAGNPVVRVRDRIHMREPRSSSIKRFSLPPPFSLHTLTRLPPQPGRHNLSNSQNPCTLQGLRSKAKTPNQPQTTSNTFQQQIRWVIPTHITRQYSSDIYRARLLTAVMAHHNTIEVMSCARMPSQGARCLRRESSVPLGHEDVQIME